MTSPKVDYQDFADDTTDFIVKLKRVFADLNIRIAAVENVKSMVDEFERRYGEVALNRIEAAVAPVLASILDGLDQSRATLAELDEYYRTNGMERVDTIIEPLIAAAVAALAEATILRDELAQFLASKQSVSGKGQPNGYAALDAGGKVPSGQLPAVDIAYVLGLADELAAISRSIDGGAIHAATEKTTLVDADELGISDSAASAWRLKRITWANIKATLKTYFDTLYAPVGRTISAGGLATGGGTLSANRTINVPKADPAAAIAGVDDTMAMTPLTTMTAINSRKLVIGPVATSGASAFDFTNIPPWARRITLLLSGLTASSGTAILVQVGTSSGVITTGYSAARATISGANSSSGSTATAFEIANASDGVIGTVTLCLDASSNTWMQAGMAGRGTSIFGSAGSLTLAGVLDRLRVSRAGTGNFSSGSITLIIE